ncbi:MAG: hypothetical protein GY820_19660 [Gammaproteobacteria bacterium]|nr:hypothetical protein [Gammaproteobacteria bacterium]
MKSPETEVEGLEAMLNPETEVKGVGENPTVLSQSAVQSMHLETVEKAVRINDAPSTSSVTSQRGVRNSPPPENKIGSPISMPCTNEIVDGI